MDQDDVTYPCLSPGHPASSRKRRRTTRSRTGCLTCRSKRVKCDEKHPECGRCARLGLNCHWEETRPSLKERREGFGPLKWREKSRWRPPRIEPLLTSNDSVVSGEDNADGTLNEASGSLHDNTVCVPEMGSNLFQWPGSQPADNLSSWLADLNSVMDITFLDHSHSMQTNRSSWASEPEYIANLQMQQVDRPVTYLPPTFLGYGFPVSGLLLSSLDKLALKYYTTEFSSVQVLKASPSSTNTQLLQLGFETEIVMRFILAASLNEISRNTISKASEIQQQAAHHFQVGSRLLTQIVQRTEEATQDHLSILASAFFSYLYLSRRKTVARASIQSLSSLISDYARRCGLYEGRAEVEVAYQPSITPTTPHVERGLLSRLMRWNFFKDVQMCFHGCGGKFATYINGNHDYSTEMQYNSYALLDDEWETRIPDGDDVLTVIQNSSVVHCIYNVFAIMQDVNDYSQNPVNTEKMNQINNKIQRFERTYAILLRLASSNIEPRSRLLVDIDITIARYHAILIYFFRSSLVHSLSQLTITGSAPTSVQKSLSSLLAIVYRTFNSPFTGMYERLQWPLFMAGIETQDPIHKSWILSHMRQSALRTALKRVIAVQEKKGHRLAMSLVKDIICGVDAKWDRSTDEVSLTSLFNDLLTASGEYDDGSDNNFCLW